DARVVAVPPRPGAGSLGEIPRALSRDHRALPADQGRVDDLPLAGPVTCFGAPHDRERRKHTRHYVGLRDTDHHRIAAGSTGEAHHAAHPLYDEVVCRPGAPRSVLTEPR